MNVHDEVLHVTRASAAMQARVDMSMACLRSDAPKSAIASSQAGPNVDKHCC